MARLLFGGDDVSMRGPYGSAQLNASGRTGIVYADATTSALADIVTYPGGAAIAGSVITVTADSQLPLFQGPADGSDTVWVSVDGGTRTPIYTNTDARLDALATSVGTKASVTYVDAQDAAAISTAETFATGAVGTEATARAAADGTRLNWRGAWTATTAYVTNDLVSFNGGLYRAPSNFTSGGSFVLANWVELVAQSGTYAPAGNTAGVWYLDLMSGGSDDAKMQAALAAWAANALGGTIILPARTLTMTSQWLIANDGASPPSQKSLTIRGQGASHNGAGGAPSGGTIVDHQYNTSVAKIDTRGHGLISLFDITFRDTSGGSLPFFQTTNTTPIIQRCEFYGSKTGTACNQDCIILGGGTRTIDGSATAKFDGYMAIVTDNHFHHIRRAVWVRPGCNDATVERNTIWSTCGAPDATYGAIDLIGDVVGSIVGNRIQFNTIEVSKYPTGIRVGNYAKVNHFEANGFYDATVTTVQGIYFDDNASYNYVVAGYTDDSFPYYAESAATAGKNLVITAHQSQQTQWAQPIKFTSLAGFGTEAVELLVSGGDGKFVVRPSAAGTSAVKLARFKRSAAEASGPDTDIAYILNGGGLYLGDGVAAPGTPTAGVTLYSSAGKARLKGSGTADAVTGSTPDQVARSILAKLVTIGLLTDSTTAYSPAPDVLASYVAVLIRSGQMSALSSGTRILLEGSANPLVSTGNSGPGVFYWDPADYAVTDHTTKMRLRLSVVTNDVAPACDFTISLRAVSSPTGAASTVAFTPGAAIASTSVAVTAPAANSLNQNATADFDVPVAGFYAIAIVTSGAMAANSSAIVKATMQIKNI